MQSNNQKTPPVNQSYTDVTVLTPGAKLKYYYAKVAATTGNASPPNFSYTQHPVNIENVLT